MGKPTVYITKGLPGSGKSTWAKDMVEKSYSIGNRKLKRVNKDELRAMLDAGHHSKANERMIIGLRNEIILASVMSGYNVIVDDTNLNPTHEEAIRDLVAGVAEVCIEDRFLEVSVEECIARDLKRPNSVGAQVIERMHHQYLQKGANVAAVEPPEPVEGPSAIICDLDGTLAIIGDRSPYAGEECAVDTLNQAVYTAVSSYLDLADEDDSIQRKVIFVSGRDEKAREATEKWLYDHTWFTQDNIFGGLYMRATGDDRNDAIVKNEIYEEHIKGKYNIDFVLDDRDRVVKFWRSIGLATFQVNYGAF